MSARERVMAIRLMEKLERAFKYAESLGVEVVVGKAGEGKLCP